MMNKFNSFHLVTPSPWPLVVSICLMNLTFQMSANLNTKTNKFMMILMITSLSMTSLKWWKDTIKESNKKGEHLTLVMSSIKMGMVLFIMSEILFFISFFWSYFHAGMSPNMDIGQMWPPLLMKSFNPINVPLLNTIILISSGVSITWSHNSIIKNNLIKSKMSLLLTCLLGVYFSLLQAMEYMQAEFSLSDSSYGTIFFMATGFHGIHVIIGTTFLTINYIMMKKNMISNNHHISFEMAAWYWHFVDVIWLFLYISIYWWGK